MTYLLRAALFLARQAGSGNNLHVNVEQNVVLPNGANKKSDSKESDQPVVAPICPNQEHCSWQHAEMNATSHTMNMKMICAALNSTGRLSGRLKLLAMCRINHLR
jgi:hypothetical protein